jgi:hypothetical protein
VLRYERWSVSWLSELLKKGQKEQLQKTVTKQINKTKYNKQT